MGIAPTGSGKTLAYLLPLLADGLCQQRCAEAASLESLVLRFQQLYPRSFQGQTGRTGSVFRLLKPLVARNDQVFERLQRLHKAKKMTELTAAIKQVEAAAMVVFSCFLYLSSFFFVSGLNLVPFGPLARPGRRYESSGPLCWTISKFKALDMCFRCPSQAACVRMGASDRANKTCKASQIAYRSF